MHFGRWSGPSGCMHRTGEPSAPWPSFPVSRSHRPAEVSQSSGPMRSTFSKPRCAVRVSALPNCAIASVCSGGVVDEETCSGLAGAVCAAQLSSYAQGRSIQKPTSDVPWACKPHSFADQVFGFARIRCTPVSGLASHPIEPPDAAVDGPEHPNDNTSSKLWPAASTTTGGICVPDACASAASPARSISSARPKVRGGTGDGMGFGAGEGVCVGSTAGLF